MRIRAMSRLSPCSLSNPERLMSVIDVKRWTPPAAGILAAGVVKILGQLRALTPFWIWGLIVLQIQLAQRWLGLDGEAQEWAQYILLGTLFPAILLVMSLAREWGRRPAYWVGLIQILMACLGIASAARFVVRHVSPAVLAFSLVHVLIVSSAVAILYRHNARAGLLAIRWKGPGIRFMLADSVGAAAVLLAIIGSWLVALRFAWWSPFTDWISGSFFASVTFVLALLLVALSVQDLGAARGKRFRYGLVADALALLIIAAASLRFDTFGGTAPIYGDRFSGTAFHHWAAIVGPAELVRQGGWLLWDVPSQYGFLSALAIALLPVKSVWQSFYIINSTLVFLAASFIYAMLRSLRPGALGFLFALGLTLAGMFVLPGCPGEWPGLYITPAVGPYRFFWCYALLGVLVWAHHTQPGKGQARTLVAGCVAWLMGVLWSAESAIYCSAIWLPSYVLLIARWFRSLGPGPRPAVRRIAFVVWLALPAALLGGAVGVITTFYLAFLGHPPDWHAYYEYCLSSGFFAWPIDPNGTVLVLLLVFAAIACTGVAYIGRGDALGSWSLSLGTWGFLWSTCSYFVGRSREIITTDLSHILVASIATTLHLHARERRNDRSSVLIRAALVPVLTVLLTAAFGDRGADQKWLTTVKRGYIRAIEPRIPPLDPALAQLMVAAKIGRDDPVAFMNLNHPGARRDGWNGNKQLDSYRAWLPTTPCSLYLPLREDRKRVYLARFVARSRSDGWLVQRKDDVDPSFSWIPAEISKTHEPAATHEDARWRLTRFVLKNLSDQGPASARLEGQRPEGDSIRR
jgi:hypothetical protein